MSRTFRVHYSISTINGVLRQQRDVPADNPDQAAALVTARHKPRPVAISKVKLVRAAA